MALRVVSDSLLAEWLTGITIKQLNGQMASWLQSKSKEQEGPVAENCALRDEVNRGKFLVVASSCHVV